ncbi:MAG TPA: hypothetical protein VE988_00025 [Gemmataceae bacterium]|nr:hypothetical protein [Gemmataceae bacterium]
MKSTKKLVFLPLVGLAIVFLTFSGGDAGPMDCQAPDEWFTGPTKEPDASVAPTPQCGFHQWSWQMFLFLTLPEGSEDRLAFMNMPPPSTMFETPKPNFAKLSLKSPLKLSASLANTDKQLPFLEIEQAGKEIGVGSGILVHRNGRALYYSQHINQRFFDFVVNNKLNDFDNFVKVAQDPKLQFPDGVLELKASWRIVEDGENTDSFFTTKAKVDRIKNVMVNGKTKVVVDPDAEPLQATVALTGLHVVGVVKGHPEFIWGTFEHNGNAPDLDPKTQPNQPVSIKDFTFYTANTKRADCNKGGLDTVTLDEMTQKLTPITNVARLNPRGGDTDQAIIKSLNDSVHAKLGNVPDALKKNRALWKNYDLVGSVWLPGTPVVPGKDFSNDAVGSKKLANATMETFKQADPKNCFGCHTTQKADLPDGNGGVLVTLPASNLNLSHALVNNLLLQKAKANAAKKDGK